MTFKEFVRLMCADDLVKAIAQDRVEAVEEGRYSKWFSKHRKDNGFYISRLDLNASLRDAPIPVHVCTNHIDAGHCTVCGEKAP